MYFVLFDTFFFKFTSVYWNSKFHSVVLFMAFGLEKLHNSKPGRNFAGSCVGLESFHMGSRTIWRLVNEESGCFFPELEDRVVPGNQCCTTLLLRNN